jgi:hypothetical protein
MSEQGWDFYVRELPMIPARKSCRKLHAHALPTRCGKYPRQSPCGPGSLDSVMRWLATKPPKQSALLSSVATHMHCRMRLLDVHEPPNTNVRL